MVILEIQANRGCLKGAGWLARQNTGETYFVSPKITPSDPVLFLTVHWTKLAS